MVMSLWSRVEPWLMVMKQWHHKDVRNESWKIKGPYKVHDESLHLQQCRKVFYKNASGYLLCIHNANHVAKEQQWLWMPGLSGLQLWSTHPTLDFRWLFEAYPSYDMGTVIRGTCNMNVYIWYKVTHVYLHNGSIDDIYNGCQYNRLGAFGLYISARNIIK